jgi:hypothetical protein
MGWGGKIIFCITLRTNENSLALFAYLYVFSQFKNYSLSNDILSAVSTCEISKNPVRRLLKSLEHILIYLNFRVARTPNNGQNRKITKKAGEMCLGAIAG